MRQIKVNLEMERLAEMLKAFQESYERNELDEATYRRLRTKYEQELQRLRGERG